MKMEIENEYYPGGIRCKSFHPQLLTGERRCLVPVCLKIHSKLDPDI